MIPLGLLTDTPENALAELHYLRRRGLPIDWVEVGEEPEGQGAPPAMTAALYRRIALRLAKEDPGAPIGGPSLIDPVADTALDDEEDSWTSAFVQSLQHSHDSVPFSFLSTELYPVEDLCEPAARMLIEAASSPRRMAERLKRDGKGELSLAITEYGLSPYGGRALLRPISALADVEILANGLSQGVTRMYLYGSSPTSAVRGERKCAGWGNLTLWDSSPLGRIRAPSVRLRVFEGLRDRWSNPSDEQEALLEVAGAPAGIDAFALRRSDHSVSILIVNRTPKTIGVKLAAFGLVDGDAAFQRIVVDRLVLASSRTSEWARETMATSSAQIEADPESLTIVTAGAVLS